MNKLTKLEFELRNKIDSNIKKIFRIFFEIFLPYQKLIRKYKKLEIKQELLNNCIFCESRTKMLDHLPSNAIVAELGTYKGFFAAEIMKKTLPKELHVIDITFKFFQNKQIFDTSRFIKHEGKSVQVLNQFKENYFDWIYIDAGHSYEDCKADIYSSKCKIKPGGFLIFNDYSHIGPNLARFGVKEAVDEFVNKEKWQVKFFIFNSFGLYDIAIQRPI